MPILMYMFGVICGINFADRARKAIVRINGSGIEGEILFFQRDVFRVFVNLTGLTGVLVCMGFVRLYRTVFSQPWQYQIASVRMVCCGTLVCGKIIYYSLFQLRSLNNLC